MEIITFGGTSNVLRVKILDSTSTTGAGKTGLTFSSTGLVISTIADNESSATTYTAAGSTVETITTLGTFAAPTATKCRFKEVDATNHPGVYELQIADARFAVASSKKLLISISGVTGMVQLDKVVELKRVDLQDATAAGLSRIDAAVSSRMATYTQPTGFLAATFPSGTVANTTNITAGVITTATNLTNLPSIPANWITAAGITAAALNGKGDWLLSSSYTAPTNLTAAQIATGVWQDATAGDFLAIGSIGKSLYTSGIGPGSTNGLATAPSGNIYSANVVQWNGNGAVTSSGLPSVSVGEMQNGVLTPAALPATGFNYTHGISLSSDQGGPAVSITGSSFSGVSITSTGGGSALNVSGSSTGNSLSISNSGSGTALRVANTGSGAGISVTGSSTLAKSGDQMDLVNAPNATAVTAMANGLLDLASAIDSGDIDTVRKAFRILLASGAGKLSGAATTAIAIRDTADTKDRITATVDASGNRSAVTYNGT